MNLLGCRLECSFRFPVKDEKLVFSSMEKIPFYGLYIARSSPQPNLGLSMLNLFKNCGNCTKGVYRQ